MKVKCINNNIEMVESVILREILKKSIRLDRPMYELEVGKTYPVQALALWEDMHLRVYLQAWEGLNYPQPYPIEFFEFSDPSLPVGWTISLKSGQEGKVLNCISFPEWASDPTFYERLIDDDSDCVRIYKSKIR